MRDREREEAVDHGNFEELEELLADIIDEAPAPVEDSGDEASATADAPGDATAIAVCDGLAEALSAVDTGLEASVEDAASEETDAGVEPPPQPVEPWEELGPVTTLGYVYDRTPRSVLRIQRGKPKNSVTVNCYVHIGCRMLLTEARCPEDDTLKKWLYEVPAPRQGSSRAEQRLLADQHMSLGKGRWGGLRSK